MKHFLLPGLLLFSFNMAFAQGLFDAPQLISNQADGPESVYAADIDGDGDIDVLSASFFDNKIAWYENTDGQGTFGTQQAISTFASGAQSVYAADIDGDGDMDVLSASSADAKVAWYENTDGQGAFGTQQVIFAQSAGPFSVRTADIDGDGDMDVLSASIADNRVAWYENTDGQGTFGDQQVIAGQALGAYSVFTADVDGDGDVDVLSASFGDGIIAWYENTDGQGNFGGQQVLSNTALLARSVHAADIDGDGDVDALSAAALGGVIAWYENTDGQGAFGEPQNITTRAANAYVVHATDLDGDGDMDVLSASENDDKVAWYENIDGQGAFGTQVVISAQGDGARSVYAADVDGDGDMDVFSASNFDDRISLHRNGSNTSVSIDQNDVEQGIQLENYPNPFTGTTTIAYSLTRPQQVRLEVYDLQGRRIRQLRDGLQPPGRAAVSFDAHGLSNGLYLYRVVAEDWERTGMMVLHR